VQLRWCPPGGEPGSSDCKRRLPPLRDRSGVIVCGYTVVITPASTRAAQCLCTEDRLRATITGCGVLLQGGHSPNAKLQGTVCSEGKQVAALGMTQTTGTYARVMNLNAGMERGSPTVALAVRLIAPRVLAAVSPPRISSLASRFCRLGLSG